jgi:hypothetical protein
MSILTTAPGVISGACSYFIGVEEVMGYLGCKQNKAYAIIRDLKKELVEAGRLTPAYPRGKIPKKYFMERCMIEE